MDVSKIITHGFLAILASFACGGVAHASSFNAIQYRPSPFVDSVFTVEGSKVGESKKFALGLDFDFSRNSMSRTPRGGEKQQIVGNLFVAHFLASGGLINDRLSAGIEFPVALYEQYTSPTTSQSDNRTRLGDLLFALKVNVLNERDFPLGLAVEPFVTFPTGSGNSFVGIDSFSGGAKVIVDKSFAKAFKADLNLGYLFRDKVDILGTDIDDRLLYGLGASWDFCDDWTLLSELSGSTVAANAFQNRIQSPLEFDIGANYEIPRSRFAVAMGAGAGLVNDNGAPLFRVSTGVNYQFGKEIVLTGEEKQRVVEKERAKQAKKKPPVVVAKEKKPPARPVEKAAWAYPQFALMKQLEKTAYFETGSSELSSAAKEELADISRLLETNELSSMSIIVAGFTDNVGSVAHSRGLSLSRAEAVKRHLISVGVDPKRIHVAGYGREFPAGPNETPEGRAQNRRVEIHLSVSIK